MKLTQLLTAAGIAIAALGVTASPAQARDGWHDSRHDNRHDNRWDNRRDDRRWHNDRRGNRGWNGHRVRCHTEWRHHHRVRVCR